MAAAPVVLVVIELLLPFCIGARIDPPFIKATLTSRQPEAARPRRNMTSVTSTPVIKINI